MTSISGTNELTLVVGDADVLIALAHDTDIHNKLALQLLQKLNKSQTSVVFPATALAESVTTLNRKINLPAIADAILERFESGAITVTEVTPRTLKLALPFFNSAHSKRNTLFDAIVCATAKQQQTETIFSFDKWYQKQGFKIATDLF